MMELLLQSYIQVSVHWFQPTSRDCPNPANSMLKVMHEDIKVPCIALRLSVIKHDPGSYLQLLQLRVEKRQ